MSQMFGVKCKDCGESSVNDYGWLVVGHCSSFDMHLTKRQANTKRNCIRFKPKEKVSKPDCFSNAVGSFFCSSCSYRKPCQEEHYRQLKNPTISEFALKNHQEIEK